MESKHNPYVRTWTKEQNEELLRKSVYTTGEIAHLCGVAQRTVCNWIDQGILIGFRIPGGADRRVTHENLARFLKDHHMGIQLEDVSEARVLCVGFTSSVYAVLSRKVVRKLRFLDADSGFTAGTAMSTFRPTHVVIDLAMGRIDSLSIASGCRRQAPGAKIVGYGSESYEWAKDRTKFDIITFGTDNLIRIVAEE